MKYCPKCGHSNDDLARFCAECGTDLTAAQTAAETQPAFETVTPVEPTSEGTTGQAYNVNFNAANEPVPQNTATLWLILNIVMTVLCCGNILGIIGIVYAALGMGAHTRGDYAKMESNTRTSRILFIVGIILGAIGMLFFVIAAAAGMLGSLGNFYPYN